MKYDPSNILNTTGHNAGGLCSLVFVPKQWVATDAVINETTNTMQTAATLTGGADWLNATFLQDTLRYTEGQEFTEEGHKFTHVITGVINGDSPDNNTLLNALPFGEYVVIYTSRNGNRRYFGNKNKGMRFSANFSTDAEFAGKESFTITFSLETQERSVQYSL
jgi:hypothetical protein